MATRKVPTVETLFRYSSFMSMSVTNTNEIIESLKKNFKLLQIKGNFYNLNIDCQVFFTSRIKDPMSLFLVLCTIFIVTNSMRLIMVS